MFKEFSNYLTQNSPYSDFWYDYASTEATAMLASFTAHDWKMLTDFLPFQNKDWQEICFELIANDDSSFAQNFILQYLSDDNAFLQYQALDTLNEQLANNFLSENQKEFFGDKLLKISFPQNNLSVKLLLASIFNKLNQ